MTILNIYSPTTTATITQRINNLAADTKPLWGKMNVGQMLAHCSVAYRQVFEENTKRPPVLVRLALQFLIKRKLTDATTPYKKNSGTAPAFIIKDERDFEKEKIQLIDYIQAVEKLSENHFEGKESNAMGKMTAQEWNNLFYKHLDHHLTQFGV